MTCPIPAKEGACSRPTRDLGFICDGHVRQLARILGDLPALAADLERTATRQDRLGDAAKSGYATRRSWAPTGPSDEGSSALVSTSIPFNWDASDLLWSAANTVGTWSRHLAESRGVPLTLTVPLSRDVRLATITAASGWLLVHVESVRMDEAAPNCYDELRHAHRAMQAAIDARDPGEFAGRCDAPYRVTVGGERIEIAREQCGTDLYRLYGRDEVKCWECGTKYDADALGLLLRRRFEREIGTATECAGWLAMVMKGVTARRIRVWAYRRQIVRVGVRQALTRGRVNDPLYRVSDVLELARKVDEGERMPKYAYP